MSRESDSSSSGPRGGSGGAAYPSGTPPYGSRQYPSPNPAQEGPQGGAGDGEGRAAAKPEEPKTETTLTTRIRINIPGSRPIPPVVMRKPVAEDGVPAPRSGEDEESSARTGSTPLPGLGSSPEPGAASGPRVGAPEDRETRGGKTGKGDGERTSDWFAPRRSKGNSSTTVNSPKAPVPPAPETTQQFPAPSVGGGPVADLPYFTDPPATGGTPEREPNGPTTGPVTGDMRMPPQGPGAGRRDDDLLAPPGPGPAGGPFDAGPRTPPGGVGPLGGGAQPPTPPGGSPLSGSLGATTGTGRGLGGDLDTSPSLFRDPDPTPSGGVPPEQVSSDTLVSGIPVVPPTAGRQGPPSPPAGDSAPPSAPAPSAPAAGKPKKAAGKPKKKGRSKLVMAAALLVVIGGGAYSAGLVMNHADVPNGTTVLGVDIGGTSKEAAVDKLDSALGDRTSAPLKVSVDGEQKEIKPSVAGLELDTEATVRGVAGRDYNPVTVVGSLFGGTHEADPSVKVDEEKLRDALVRLAGTSGTAREGTIKFEAGRAVPVYGKAGKALDVDRAVQAVSDAYRGRAETGQDKVITLPVGAKRPTISKAEVDQKMKTFAKPAMSGLVTVRTDAQHSIPFGPDKSLPKILSMRVVNGKLVEHYDLPVLKQLYGSTFDGVLIRRGTGSKKPVTPQDVVVALRQALVGKTAADRVGVIGQAG